MRSLLNKAWAWLRQPKCQGDGWGWLLLAWATVTGILLLLNINLFLLDSTADPYLALQLSGQLEHGYWESIAEASRGLVVLLRGNPMPAMTGLFLAPFFIAHLRYRGRPPALLMGVMVVGYASIPFSRAMDQAYFDHPPNLGTFFIGGLITLLFALGVLLLMQWRGKSVARRATTRAGVIAVAIYLLVGWWLVSLAGWGLAFGDLDTFDWTFPARWKALLAPTDHMLPFWAFGVVSFFLLHYLLEAPRRERPSRKLQAGLLLLPFLAVGFVASRDLSPWLAPASAKDGPARPNVHEETLFLIGSQVLGTRWDTRSVYLAAGIGDQVDGLLASGAVDAPVAYDGTTPWPPLTTIRMDPHVDSVAYVARLREASPASNTAFFGLVVGRQNRRHPLSDDEVATWTNSVVTLPSRLDETLYLLENLVGSGRRDQALVVLAHIQGLLGQLPPEIAGYAREVGDAWGTPTRQEETKLRALALAAQGLPAPDGAERSLRVRITGLSGEPLPGVAVGLIQAYGLTVIRQADGSLDTEPSPFSIYPDGLLAHTDEQGGALFGDLRGAEYGVVVYAGWPGSPFSAGSFAFPREPLPDPLPPGETVWEWQVLSAGRLVAGEEGWHLLPAAHASMDLLAVCPWLERQKDCHGGLKVRSGSLVGADPSGPALAQVVVVGRDGSGFPVAVWVPEGFPSEPATNR